MEVWTFIPAWDEWQIETLGCLTKGRDQCAEEASKASPLTGSAQGPSSQGLL